MIHSNRRQFLNRMALGASLFAVPGAFAEQLTLTPRQTEGPFYPDKMPLDTDNDLLILNDSITPAVGEITHLGGRILNVKGEPIRNAVIEIWQTDNNGVYIHTQSAKAGNLDKNFQGFGRFMTGSSGEYYFRTIKPAKYPGRTPHIHFAVYHGGHRVLTSQFYIKGDPQNAKDGLVRRITDPKARETVMIDFVPMKDSKIGELAARADVVVGLTPEDPEPNRGGQGGPRPPR